MRGTQERCAFRVHVDGDYHVRAAHKRAGRSAGDAINRNLVPQKGPQTTDVRGAPRGAAGKRKADAWRDYLISNHTGFNITISARSRAVSRKLSMAVSIFPSVKVCSILARASSSVGTIRFGKRRGKTGTKTFRL